MGPFRHERDVLRGSRHAGSMAGLSTLTVVFTDVVGSTAQRVQLGEDVADRLVRRHDALVHEAVDRAGGRVVKGLGDGAMACFGSAADAVAAAVGLQQALQRHAATAPEGERLQVRIGIATGDVREQDDDLLGTPVIEASRLCSAAAGGEILVAELVRLLARGRGDVAFEPLGELVLRGLPEPVPACRVLWPPAPPDTAGPVPLPPGLAAAQASSYVGRTAQLRELDEAWSQALLGGRHTVLLAGEPGIGKTRTAAELARRVHAEGALVMFGRCDEGLAAPYQPFVEALGAYVRGAGAGAALGRLPGELQRLVPELREHGPASAAPVASDVRSEEYRLFEAVTSWLAAASRSSGLLLVLDDLHWATRPTLQLLMHVLHRLPEEDPRVLVLVTYRDTDVERAHPLVGVLADLRRQSHVRRLPLVGLTEQEVLEVLEEAAGHELDAAAQELGRLLQAETEGNPFFVGEVLRHLVESGVVRRVEGRWLVPDSVDLDIPEGVRDVVGRRVSRLSPQANQVMSIAAVVGREASVDVLTAVSGLADDEVCEALDEGVRARLLQETHADHYRFSHALVRTTLYEELSATRRRRVHRRVADVLEQLHGDDVVSLAHHLLEAGPEGGDSSRAVRYALAAGEHGVAQRAPADAERWFRHALELLEDAAADDPAELVARIGLGGAQRDQGDPRFRETLLDAARRADAADQPELLVAAVLANQRGYSSLIGRVDQERVARIERALEVVGPEASATRARLLALLASELAFDRDPGRHRRLAEDAVRLARTSADDPTLAHVLAQVCGPLYDPADFPRWRRLCEEAAALAERLGDPALTVVTGLFASAAQLADGEPAASRARTEADLGRCADVAPGLQWAMRGQMLRYVIATQPPAVAAAENDASLAMGEALGEPDRVNWWASSATAVHVAQHYRIGALSDLAQDFARQFPGARGWWATAALCLADAGRTDEAQALLRRKHLTAQELLQEPFPFFGPSALARIALRCEDGALAEQAEQALTPHRHRWVHFFTGITGPVTVPLGLCASVQGRHHDAVGLVEEAVEQVRSAGFPSLLLTTELDLATVLARRGAAGDRPRLISLCDRLEREARERGCTGAAAEAAALRPSG